MKVLSIEHLIELAANPNGDFEHFYILYANGLASSSKRILYTTDFEEFSIINEIDESFQEFHISEIGNKTQILEAIDKGVLFKSLV